MQLIVTPASGLSAAAWPVEVVERKGLGHPDTICDALADEFSAALSRHYLERFGLILHHNVDKALLWGGASRPAFGGGAVLEPFEVYLAGRTTQEFRGVRVPVDDLALESCRAWLAAHFHALDPDKHVKLHIRTRRGSADLVGLYLRQQQTGVWLANDSSCGVGYAPRSDLETIVYEVERELNSAAVKRESPEVGEDIKVLGVRAADAISLTVACAFIDRFVSSIDDYCQKRESVRQRVLATARRHTKLPLEAAVNAADEIDTGNIYLSVTGTSAEAGDDGQVGRGNRTSGLITPYRPMTMEAAAGKNPVTHVGKLYNVAARLIAEAVVEHVPSVAAAECYLVSRIGRPVTEPQLAQIKLEVAAGETIEALRPRVETIASDLIAGIGSLWRELIDRKISVY